MEVDAHGRCKTSVDGGKDRRRHRRDSGIGKATAQALAAAGARTVLTARSETSGREAVADIRRSTGSDDVELVVFDLADLDSVRRGAADLLDRCDRIDVLVNNAGLILSERTETKDGFEATFGINHLGPFLLTTLLLDRIIASAPARIVNVSSTAHRSARRGLDFDDLQSTKRYTGMQAYGRSKLANILFTTELARRLEGTGVTANAVHPGTVATGFARDGDANGVFAFGVKVIKPFVLTPEKGRGPRSTSPPRRRSQGSPARTSSSAGRPSPLARPSTEAAAAQLWAASEQLVSEASPAA